VRFKNQALLLGLPLGAFLLSQFIPTVVRPTAVMPPGEAAAQAPAAGRVEYTQFRSASLGADVRCAISLPPSYDADSSRRYPVVIFLHGLFNDERDWEKRGVQDQLGELRAAGKVGEFIVAIPFGANSFFINGKDGTRYEDAIVKDFLPFVDGSYRTLGTPAKRAIQGISMGGFGALALFDDLPKPPASGGDARGRYRYEIASKLFGAPPDMAFFKANSPLHLAKANAAKLKNLKIYFDVGQQDRYGFESGNAELHAILTAEGVKHEYFLVPGDHGWSFLAARAEPAFTFVWNALK
jgi:S-formylglutathione hydrolase FrmB